MPNCVDLYGYASSDDKSVMAYITGEHPIEFGKTWVGAKKVYTPFNLSSNHWVALEIDLEERKINVYDCRIDLHKDDVVFTALAPMCQLIPILLKKSGLFGDIDDSLFTLHRVDGLHSNDLG